MKKCILLVILFLPISLLAQEFSGQWYSSFTVMGTSMRMNLDVVESPEVTVTVSNPDMNSSEIECDEAEVNGNEFYFKLESLNLTYKGSKTGDSIQGEMQQHGLKWDVTFTREEQEKAVANRPQEPKPPFPYKQDSLQIENGDISLGATIILPNGFDKNTPIVILSSGSGPQNRDCAIAGHKPFWVIADHLARNNIACVRFDDRGTGTSTGNYNEATLMDLASDVEAVSKYVRKDLMHKKNPLGLLGHSEGGMHTLIAANNYNKIDFLIQLATVGTTGKDVLIQQQYDIPVASGESQELAKWNQDTYLGMSNIVLEYPQDVATDSLTTFLGNQYENAPEGFDKSTSGRLQFILGNIMFINSQWMREFLQFETASYLPNLEKREVMMLVIHGEKDVQVTPELNNAGFREYEYAELAIIEGVNHLMQHCTTCSMQEYGELEETISPTVLNYITTWVQKFQ